MNQESLEKRKPSCEAELNHLFDGQYLSEDTVRMCPHIMLARTTLASIDTYNLT